MTAHHPISELTKGWAAEKLAAVELRKARERWDQLQQVLAELRQAEARRASLADERDALIRELAQSGVHGMVTKLAELVGVSRQLIHRIAAASGEARISDAPVTAGDMRRASELIKELGIGPTKD